jgi:hypothetical protein
LGESWFWPVSINRTKRYDVSYNCRTVEEFSVATDTVAKFIYQAETNEEYTLISEHRKTIEQQSEQGGSVAHLLRGSS